MGREKKKNLNEERIIIYVFLFVIWNDGYEN